MIDDRTRRAVREPMLIVPPSLWPPSNTFAIYTDDEQYVVEANPWRCTCGDYEHRRPDGGCKHIRRVRLVTGVDPAPESLRPVSDPNLGDLCADGPRWEARDSAEQQQADRAAEPEEQARADGGVSR